jgi:hypothetical protein
MPAPLLRITRMLSILPLACLPLSACAAQDAPVRDGKWVLLATSVEARTYLDSTRVQMADGKHTVWLWFDYTEPETDPSDPEKQFWGIQTRHRLDCAAQQTDDLELVLLDREGTPVDTLEGSRWKTFADHPFGKTTFPIVCAWLGRHRPLAADAAGTRLRRLMARVADPGMPRPVPGPEHPARWT